MITSTITIIADFLTLFIVPEQLGGKTSGLHILKLERLVISELSLLSHISRY